MHQKNSELPISILILTLDEEINLPGCFKSISWCDDIVILDSYSQDKTKSIAEQHGARVKQRQFDNYAAQRNYGLKEITYKHQWVLMLDADERVSQELYYELNKLSELKKEDSEIAMFLMRRKDFFFGTWIRRSGGYPTWFGRLVNPELVEVKREINEEYHTDGNSQSLCGHLLHYPFNKGISSWIKKHDRYSTMEAQYKDKEKKEAINFKELFSKEPTARRKNLKNLVYSLPGRPVIIFLALYLFRGGFLEGRAGFTFAALRAMYEFWIDLKYREIKRRNMKLPI